jgi:hypothetical protein
MSARPEELLKIRPGKIARRRTANGIARARLRRDKENATAMQSATNRPGIDVLVPSLNKTAKTRSKTSTNYSLAGDV